MMNNNSNNNDKSSIYIIAGQKRNAINDRVTKVFSLAEQFTKMQLVTPDNRKSGANELSIKPASNPTGLLRILGLNKMKKKIDSFLFFPSNNILYAKAVESALKISILADIHKDLSVTLLICVPPHDLCILGSKLKTRFPQIRLIMDWQDLWSHDENYFLRAPKLYRQRLLAAERKTLGLADLNITTNTFARSLMIHKFNIPANKIISISHHFNREDLPTFNKKQTRQPDDAIKIGFLGTLFKPPRVPGQDVVDTIQALRYNGLNVELHVHGMVSKETKDQLLESNMEGIFLHGQSSHQESLKQVANYDFMLLLLADLPNSRIVMSIKLPHYFLTGKPILAIVPEDSALANIITTTAAGFIIDSSNEFYEPLHKILTDYMEGQIDYKPNMTAIQSYSWDNISHLWLQALKQTPDNQKAIS